MFTIGHENLNKNNYTEIIKLDKLLTDEKIPHTSKNYMGGYILRYFGKKEIKMGDDFGPAEGEIYSAAQHKFTDIRQKGLIEFEFTKTKKSDFIDAQTAFEIIKEHYNSLP